MTTIPRGRYLTARHAAQRLSITHGLVCQQAEKYGAIRFGKSLLFPARKVPGDTGHPVPLNGQYLTAKEAAKRLTVTPQRVCRLQDRLGAVRFGKFTLMFPASAVEEYRAGGLRKVGGWPKGRRRTA